MHQSPLAWLALRAITLYQRHLSPRKGYCCALHALSAVRSCSAYGYRAIARGGLLQGLVLLRRRLAACARVHANTRRYVGGTRYQRGFCDAGCDVGGCDGLSGCDAPSDVLGCVGDACSCDWPWRRREDPQPATHREDYLNNETALRERVRQARARQRPGEDA